MPRCWFPSGLSKVSNGWRLKPNQQIRPTSHLLYLGIYSVKYIIYLSFFLWQNVYNINEETALEDFSLDSTQHEWNSIHPNMWNCALEFTIKFLAKKQLSRWSDKVSLPPWVGILRNLDPTNIVWGIWGIRVENSNLIRHSLNARHTITKTNKRHIDFGMSWAHSYIFKT